MSSIFPLHIIDYAEFLINFHDLPGYNVSVQVKCSNEKSREPWSYYAYNKTTLTHREEVWCWDELTVRYLLDIVTCGPLLGNELVNTLPRRDWFLETNWLRNTVSRDTENWTIAGELIHDPCDVTTEQKNYKIWWLLSRPRGSYKSSWFVNSRAV
jgi:hypothetical protein